MKIIFYYLTIFLLININNVKTDLATAKAIKNLILGPNYDSAIPPQDLTVIAVGNLFKQIVKLDQTSQFLTSSSTLVANWNDSRLIWNSTKYPMNTISLKAKQIWLPDLYVINSGDSNGFLQVNDYSLATVFNDGSVIMVYPLNSKFIFVKVNN
jgi:hypothetical protein